MARKKRKRKNHKVFQILLLFILVLAILNAFIYIKNSSTREMIKTYELNNTREIPPIEITNKTLLGDHRLYFIIRNHMNSTVNCSVNVSLEMDGYRTSGWTEYVGLIEAQNITHHTTGKIKFGIGNTSVKTYYYCEEIE